MGAAVVCELGREGHVVVAVEIAFGPGVAAAAFDYVSLGFSAHGFQAADFGVGLLVGGGAAVVGGGGPVEGGDGVGALC